MLRTLQENANNLQEYATRNSLTIHPDKCEIILISKHRLIGPLSKVEINGKVISIVPSSKCLGLTIDENLTWEDHAHEISKSFGCKVKKLYQMRSMPKSTLTTIYHQGILPSVLYGISVWGNCSPTIMANVERIHIRAARFIHKVKKSTPDAYVLQQVKWSSIVEYYKRSLACKVYKIYNDLTSPLLKDMITKSTSSRTTRNALKLDLPSFRYVDYKRSFRYRGAYIWNNIPTEIREKKSYMAFKNCLKRSDALKKIFFAKYKSGKALDFENYFYY